LRAIKHFVSAGGELELRGVEGVEVEVEGVSEKGMQTFNG